MTVYLQGSDPKFNSLIGQMADEYAATVKGAVKPTIVKVDPRPGQKDGVVLTIGIKAGVSGIPPGTITGGMMPLAFDDQVLKDNGVLLSLALENWGRAEKQRYAIPLLWDPWGLTGSPADLPGADGKGVGLKWLIDSSARKIPVLYAGGTPAGLSLRFWLLNGLPAFAQYPAGITTNPTVWASDQVMSQLRNFVISPVLPGTIREAAVYGAADLENIRKMPGKRLVLETFSAQQALPVQTIRRFRVLIVRGNAGTDKRSWIPATVLAASLTGSDPEAAKLATGFAAFLLNKDNQRRLADLTGFLPADFRAPGVNAEAAETRKASISVDAILAIDPARADYGTEAAAWSELLTRISQSPASWEAIVREKSQAKS